MAWQWNDVSGDIAGILSAFVLGFVYDAAVFSYIAIPFVLLAWLLPASRHGVRLDKILTTVLTVIFCGVLIFTSIAEILFWDEFSTRFNFIAVDYLVYTHEVIANIRESYPLVPLIAGLVVSSLALTALLNRVWVFPRIRYLNRNVPKLSVRTATAAFAIFLAFAGYRAANQEWADKIQNAYLSESARNGFYSIFYAFWHNELDYQKLYATTADPAQNLKAEIAGKNSAQSVYMRRIANNGAPIKPNVMFVIMESLSADYMGTFGNNGGLTPNLDRLATQGLLFTNMYANGTRTVRGLEALTLSTPPSPGNSIVRRPENDGLFSLGHVFRSKGYETLFVYGGFGYFDNMNGFYSANEYHVYDRSDFPKNRVAFANAWGVDDESLFNNAIDLANDRYSRKKPFFVTIMTVSNHRPYTYPSGKIDLPSGKSGRAGGVKFADYAVGRLIEESKNQPWFKNTIFVFVADHTAGSAGKAELTPEKYHIPAIVYAPHLIQPKKINQMVSQIDLPPTLLGLMNWSYDSAFLGKDALRQPVHRAFIGNYQKLGYLTENGKLTVLLPKKQFRQYQNGELLDAVDEPHRDKAVAYYQYASDWKKHLKLPKKPADDRSEKSVPSL